MSDIKRMLRDGGVEQVGLLFDEIEFVTHGLSGNLGKHWDDDFVPFWQTIRATHQETDNRLTFIVAGVNPASVEESHFGGAANPIFQLATPHYLEPFPATGIREMVRTIGRYSGLAFAEDVYTYLTERFGGHPYLVRLACSEVWQSLDTSDPQSKPTATVQDFESRNEQIRQRIGFCVQEILVSLLWWYPDDYDLLELLARGENKFVKEYTRAHWGSISVFVRHGLLKESDKPDFAIADVKEFLRTRGDRYRKVMSPFRGGDVPQEALPTAPDLDLLSELFRKRAEIELQLRKAIMVFLGVKFGYDQTKVATAILESLPRRNDRPDPAALFIGREPRAAINELFTPDLKEIVVRHWDSFGPLFDLRKDRFEMNMDDLNRARRTDAHAKPISANEADLVLNSYAWLRRRLDRVPE